jgi:hydroxymethylglutaryl-CoA reductase
MLPLPLGTVGGATQHPTAVWARKLMGVTDAKGLAAVIGAVGLAQNFAALLSLADEGIIEAHKRLRRRSR